MFNLKLFVLVGILAGFRDVYGTEDVKDKDDDGFIVGKWTENQKNEVNAAVADRRVIIAVYKTEEGGNVPIIHESFKDKLSKAFVCAGKGEDVVKEVDISSLNNNVYRIHYDMQKKVEYTVYFIFKKECFDGTAGDLLNSTAWMFENCPNLIRADFRFFNTKKVENMSSMFWDCSSLTELDLSKFDTQNVTNMSDMFEECTSLKQVFLPSTCAEKKKKCICCGDEYVRWNNHEVGGLKPDITTFKAPNKINLMIPTEK
jgi:surface protein